MAGLFSIGAQAIDRLAQLLATADIPPLLLLKRKLWFPLAMDTNSSEFPELYIIVSSSSIRKDSPW
jgi:hypothetical protein